LALNELRFSRPNSGDTFMMASAFSQLTDTATSIAWQLTLSLLHVLWFGTAIIVFAAIVNLALAQRRSTAKQTVDESRSARVRHWVNMVALLMVGAALPFTFAVVRSSESAAAQRDNDNTPVVDERTLTDATVIVTNMEKVSHQLLPSESRDDVTSSTALTENSAEAKQSILAIVSGRARIAAPFVACIYLAGVLLMFVRLAAAICGGQRLTSLGQPVVERSVLDVLAAQAERLALKTAPAVAYCERVAVPVVVGVLKPVILLCCRRR
jgi:beta-lactamase regulating signal transducer with metallopeptidase domain